MQIAKGAQTTYQIGYHFVWGVKYHKHLINQQMREVLVKIIKTLCYHYNYHYYCLGIATNHIHFFVGAPPKIAPAVIIKTVKSISAKKMFQYFPRVKNQLWGGQFWKDGYYVGTVGQTQTENIILEYLKKQQQYQRQPELRQMRLFY